MIGIIGIVALLTVLGLSLLVTRIATVALTLTGLSHEAARFQARSAFTGTGFTTSEAEHAVNHPVRRRIIMSLMLLRSAGIVTILLSLILSFVGAEDGSGKLYRLLWLVGGVAVLWLLSASRWVDRFVRYVMTWALKRWTDLDVRDYVGLLRLSGDYVIRELHMDEGDWLVGRTLSDCRLRQEGVSIIGIYRRNGNYVGVPRGDTTIHAGDVLVLYGRAEALKKLDRRRQGGAGDQDHSAAVDDEQRRMAEQNREEAAYERVRRDFPKGSS